MIMVPPTVEEIVLQGEKEEKEEDIDNDDDGDDDDDDDDEIDEYKRRQTMSLEEMKMLKSENNDLLPSTFSRR